MNNNKRNSLQYLRYLTTYNISWLLCARCNLSYVAIDACTKLWNQMNRGENSEFVWWATSSVPKGCFIYELYDSSQLGSHDIFCRVKAVFTRNDGIIYCIAVNILNTNIIWAFDDDHDNNFVLTGTTCIFRI